MLRKTTGFIIAFAIVFSSVIPAFSAQADNSVPQRFTSSVQLLQNAVPSTTRSSDSVTLTDEAYYVMKDKRDMYRNLLITVSIILAVVSIGFIALAVFLLSRPKYLRKR